MSSTSVSSAQAFSSHQPIPVPIPRTCPALINSSESQVNECASNSEILICFTGEHSKCQNYYENGTCCHEQHLWEWVENLMKHLLTKYVPATDSFGYKFDFQLTQRRTHKLCGIVSIVQFRSTFRTSLLNYVKIVMYNLMLWGFLIMSTNTWWKITFGNVLIIYHLFLKQLSIRFCTCSRWLR